MPRGRRFSYYDRLSAKDKATYRKSDEITGVTLADPNALAPLVRALEEALASGKRIRVAGAASALTDALTADLGVPKVRVRVRLVRPKLHEGAELHGLYTFAESGTRPVIEVWMRTAAKAATVRFRTFLRTLLHEIVHHLDVTLFGFDESFHTDGFFRRESSLVRQLLGEPRTSSKKPRQMTLF